MAQAHPFLYRSEGIDHKAIMHLKVKGISKRFGAIRALKEVNLECKPGEIHALLGANGSGKSTFIRILSGLAAPDKGEIFIDGKRTFIQSPKQSREQGIATVHQDFSLVPHLSVRDNLLLGVEPRRIGGFISFLKMQQQAAHLLAKMGAEIPLELPVGQLSVSDQQIIEIIKAIALKPKLLLLDEPTASLHKDQVNTLFTIIKKLRNEGVSVIFASHRLNEIFALCDRATILRDGRSIDTVNLDKVTEDKILEMMMGEKEEVTPAPKATKGQQIRESPALRLENVAVAHQVKNINLVARDGEIIGLGGLQGQGQPELLKALYGLISLKEGAIYLKDNKVRIRSPREAIRYGIVYISGDRQEGLLPARTVRENLSIISIARQSMWKAVSRRGEAQDALKVINSLDIVCESLESPAWQLSGGNQQKMIIGRWLIMKPQIMLLNDPTKGVDIQTKYKIYDLLFHLSSRGTTILFFSTDTSELISIASRVLVMYEGRVIAELANDELTERNVLAAALAMRNNSSN